MNPLENRPNGYVPPSPQDRTTRDDMYHDVGMYRDKPFTESVDDMVNILERGRIYGRTAKGAQVSADAGPTNWMESALTLRIRQGPNDAPGLMIDTNSPRYAHWYCTMAPRAPIELPADKVEVIVNGDTPEQVEARMAQVRHALEQAALQVPIRSIGSFLTLRAAEIAEHLPPDEAAALQEGMATSPLWAQKAVGDMAARRGDEDVAAFYHSGAVEAALQARDRIADMAGAPAAEAFVEDLRHLSEGEQMLLAERFVKPRTYAVEAAADGYIMGTGLSGVLDDARKSI